MLGTGHKQTINNSMQSTSRVTLLYFGRTFCLYVSRGAQIEKPYEARMVLASTIHNVRTIRVVFVFCNLLRFNSSLFDGSDSSSARNNSINTHTSTNMCLTKKGLHVYQQNPGNINTPQCMYLSAGSKVCEGWMQGVYLRRERCFNDVMMKAVIILNVLTKDLKTQAKFKLQLKLSR